MLRSPVPRTSWLLRWTPNSAQCNSVPLAATRSLSSRTTMSLNIRIGIRLHDLNTGILSRELRLRIPRTQKTVHTTRPFHTSRPRSAVPLIPALAAALKSSSALGVLSTIFRVALTLVPAFVIRGKFLHKYIKKAANHDFIKAFPKWANNREKVARHLVYNNYILKVLFTVPAVLLAATLLASLERAPLTGRWRFILVSPKEEDDIVKSLSGTWRAAVNSVLASTLDTGEPPPALAISDWRHQWVEQTLRRLESAVPLLQAEQAAQPFLFEGRNYPYPPPSRYPLYPRPRPAHVLHSWAEHAQYDDQAEPLAPLIGPPYSCLVVEKPDSQNAFSYGFGPNGAGGVVVYTGFLCEVLKNTPCEDDQTTSMPTFWSRIFGTLVRPPRQDANFFTPTEEQTAELAVLLAHELSHLLLAHHLESLSSGSILYPSVISIFTDVARTVLFPATMLLGPFVNDALGQMGKVNTGEIGRLSEMCNGRRLEIEADIVSARLLAYAGFDPREAVKFWEHRIDESKRAECAIQGRTPEEPSRVAWAMGREIHPLNHERVRRLKEELDIWKSEWAKLGVSSSN